MRHQSVRPRMREGAAPLRSLTASAAVPICAGRKDCAGEQREPAMSNGRRDCPKCKALMEKGFIADYTNGHAKRMQSRWIEGDPVRSIWLGLSFRGPRVLDVATFRCTSCGFLETVAK